MSTVVEPPLVKANGVSYAECAEVTSTFLRAADFEEDGMQSERQIDPDDCLVDVAPLALR